MKITVLCGFLGAGKTTLLHNLLQEDMGKTAVLVNEFGEAGIDGSLVAVSSQIDVIELPNGCICCSLKHDLVKGIKDIRHLYHPERLIIEPSGLSAPSAIVSAIQESELADWTELTAVIGIIDGPSFLDDWNSENYGRFFRDQVTNSDVLLINKTDLMSDDLLQASIYKVAELNPVALIFPTQFCRTALPQIAGHRVGEHHHFRADLDSLSLTVPAEIRQTELTALSGRLQQGNFGQVVRAKGILRVERGWVNFDYVNGRWQVVPYPDRLGVGKAVFIGTNLNKALLCQSFGSGQALAHQGN